MRLKKQQAMEKHKNQHAAVKSRLLASQVALLVFITQKPQKNPQSSILNSLQCEIVRSIGVKSRSRFFVDVFSCFIAKMGQRFGFAYWKRGIHAAWKTKRWKATQYRQWRRFECVVSTMLNVLNT